MSSPDRLLDGALRFDGSRLVGLRPIGRATISGSCHERGLQAIDERNRRRRLTIPGAPNEAPIQLIAANFAEDTSYDDTLFIQKRGIRHANSLTELIEFVTGCAAPHWKFDAIAVPTARMAISRMRRRLTRGRVSRPRPAKAIGLNRHKRGVETPLRLRWYTGEA
jgi:hypothetical protein